MEKFSKLEKRKKKKGDDVLWTNDWVKVISFEDWTIVEGKDCVVCVPILMDSNQTILRYEYVPTYKKRSGDDHFLTILAGTIEEGETPEECLRRELVEEAGIVLRDNVSLTFEDSLFVSKGCNTKYNLCILPLYRDDYYETKSKGDGSKAEKLSKSVKVNNYNLDDLKGSDTITELMLMKVRKYLNM